MKETEESPCRVHFCSDQEVCATCGMVWDANDPYPPTCQFETGKRPGWFTRALLWLFGGKPVDRP